jgi:hypothetical protein
MQQQAAEKRRRRQWRDAATMEEDGERFKGKQLREDRGIYDRRRASENQNGRERMERGSAGSEREDNTLK